MSVTALRDFVLEVATDSDLAMRFAVDPVAVLERIELTDAEKTAVLARDSARLRVALGAPRLGAMTANNDKHKKKKKKKGKTSKKRPTKPAKKR
jgi:hypothetical protein